MLLSYKDISYSYCFFFFVAPRNNQDVHSKSKNTNFSYNKHSISSNNFSFIYNHIMQWISNKHTYSIKMQSQLKATFCIKPSTYHISVSMVGQNIATKASHLPGTAGQVTYLNVKRPHSSNIVPIQLAKCKIRATN